MFRTILLIITYYNDVIINELTTGRKLLEINEPWLKPQPTLFKVYIYNVTNTDSFLNNGTKPRVEELGPYVYEETRVRENVVLHQNGTISFNQKNIYKFNPELSNSTEDDVVTVPNIPMLKFTSQSKYFSVLLRLGMSNVIATIGVKPFIKVAVRQLLWGYEDMKN